jgi:hypothetical protein
LFGRNFEWKIGLLDKLFKYLRPVRAQEIAEATEEEIQEKALQYMRRLGKVRILKSHGGVRLMGIKNLLQKVNANKWTILGAGALTAGGVLSGLGLVDPASVKDVADMVVNGLPLEQGAEGIATFVGLGAAGVAVYKSIFGKGIESVEQFQARKAEEAKVKLEQKQLKASGQVQAQKAVTNLVNKLHIPEAQAKEIIAAQVKAKQEVEALKQKQVEDKKVQALAKKLGVTPEKAVEIVKEQKAAAQKLAEAKAALKAAK